MGWEEIARVPHGDGTGWGKHHALVQQGLLDPSDLDIALESAVEECGVDVGHGFDDEIRVPIVHVVHGIRKTTECAYHMERRRESRIQEVPQQMECFALGLAVKGPVVTIRLQSVVVNLLLGARVGRSSVSHDASVFFRDKSGQILRRSACSHD